MSFIKISNLTKTYNDKTVPVHALQGIDLEIRKGEFFSIAGPSGSGKTTLLNIMGGLDNATSGAVDVNGQLITDMTKTQQIVNLVCAGMVGSTNNRLHISVQIPITIKVVPF